MTFNFAPFVMFTSMPAYHHHFLFRLHLFLFVHIYVYMERDPPFIQNYPWKNRKIYEKIVASKVHTHFSSCSCFHFLFDDMFRRLSLTIFTSHGLL